MSFFPLYSWINLELGSYLKVWTLSTTKDVTQNIFHICIYMFDMQTYMLTYVKVKYIVYTVSFQCHDGSEDALKSMKFYPDVRCSCNTIWFVHTYSTVFGRRVGKKGGFNMQICKITSSTEQDFYHSTMKEEKLLCFAANYPKVFDCLQRVSKSKQILTFLILSKFLISCFVLATF